MPIAVCPEFRILYEDTGVLVVDKAAPLLTHPTGEKNEPTLWHGLHELLAYEVATGGQVSLINRLDRETSGITLVAKTAEAARELGKARPGCCTRNISLWCRGPPCGIQPAALSLSFVWKRLRRLAFMSASAATLPVSPAARSSRCLAARGL